MKDTECAICFGEACRRLQPRCLAHAAAGAEAATTPSFHRPPAAAEGLYNGLSVTNRVVRWLVLDDGSYYLFYAAIGQPNEFAGVVQGTAVTSGSSLSSGNARDFNAEGQGFRNTSLSADFVSKKTISGTTTLGGTGTTLSGSYDSAYDNRATLAALAGNYVGVVAAAAGPQAGAINVGSSGALAGVWFGRVFTGTATPRSKGNAYDLSINFSRQVSCAYSGLDFQGVVYVDAVAKRFYAAAPNAARTDGLLFVGQRP